jgi:hypothetical protein
MRTLVRSIFIISFFLVPFWSVSQMSGADSAMRASAESNAIQLYHRFIGNESALYNGQQYMEYDNLIHVGHPYFQSREFVMASVMYDNILYENVPLKFDIIKKNLIVKSPVGEFSFVLFDDKIRYFEMSGHKFIRLVKDSANQKVINTGFYEQLYKGNSIGLLKKDTKKIQEDLNYYDGTRRSVVETADYYFRLNGMYHPVNTKSQALEVLKDKKTELKPYIRKNKLKFRANKEADMIKLVSYYDTIKK